MGATVVEGDPLAGFWVLPDDEVAVEELERGGHAGVEVLDEGHGVPVVPPHELLVGRRRARSVSPGAWSASRGRTAAATRSRVSAQARRRRRRPEAESAGSEGTRRLAGSGLGERRRDAVGAITGIFVDSLGKPRRSEVSVWF